MSCWLVGAAVLVGAPLAAAAVPANGAFDGGLAPWTTTTSCTACTVTVSHDPAGAALTKVDTVLGLGTTSARATWNSASFPWTGPSPASATLRLRDQVDVSTLVSLGGTGSLQVLLVDDTASTAVPLGGEPSLATTGQYVDRSLAVDPGLLVDGHDYRVRIVVGLDAGITLLSTSRVWFDDVVLDSVPVVAPQVADEAAIVDADGTIHVAAWIVPDAADTTWWLEWGGTPALGNVAPGGTIAAGAAATRASATISGAAPGSTTSWRFVAQNVAGRTDGAVGGAYVAPAPTPGGGGGDGTGGDGGGGAAGDGGGGGTGTATGGGGTTGVVRETIRTVVGSRCTIVGTSGPDVLVGTPRRDVICGLGGDDVIVGGAGNDEIDGGAGNDRIDAGSGKDRVVGGSGRDVVLGGTGNDTLLGSTGNDVLRGGSGNDRIEGGPGADRLDGGSGRDRLLGAAGADVLLGGPGMDLLFGGPGRDRLLGGTGRDRLYGGPHADVLVGGPGDDAYVDERVGTVVRP